MGLAEKLNAKLEKSIAKQNAKTEYHKAKIAELESEKTYTLNEIINGIDYPTNIKITDDTVTIIPGNKDEEPVEIRRHSIDAKMLDSKKITVENKSVIGRAVVGGALFGGIGAVVGGMSGMKPEAKAKIEPHLYLSYRQGDETIYREFRKLITDSAIKQAYKALKK